MKTKTCYTCKKTFPLDSFYKNRSRSSGYDGQCKACRKERHRKYQQENRERVNGYARKHYYKHGKKKQEEPAIVQNGIKLAREKFYWED